MSVRQFRIQILQSKHLIFASALAAFLSVNAALAEDGKASKDASASGSVVRTYTRTYKIVNGERVLVTSSESKADAPAQQTPQTVTRRYVRRILPDGSVQTIQGAPSVTPVSKDEVSFATKRTTRTYRIMPDGSRVEVLAGTSDFLPNTKEIESASSTKLTAPVRFDTVTVKPATVHTIEAVPTDKPVKLDTVPKGEIPDGSTVNLILWSTLSNIDAAVSGKDYTMLWRTISPRLQSELTPATLQASFITLGDSGMKMGDAVGQMPVFEMAPYILKDGRMRLRGLFDMQPKDIRFDLLYVHTGGLWRLDAIAFAEGE